MKHLIIIGARGAGREIYNAAINTVEYENNIYDIKGFLDDKTDALDNMPGYPQILGSVEDYIIQSDDIFICALGEPKWRKYYSEIILSKGGVFTNIISKSANIGKNTKIGVGCVIMGMVSVSCDVEIGNFVYIQGYSVIGHDVKVGNYCHLGTYSFIGGYAKLDDMAILQTRATLLPHKIIGKGGIVGAGSVAIRNVESGITVMGVPAKKIQY